MKLSERHWGIVREDYSEGALCFALALLERQRRMTRSCLTGATLYVDGGMVLYPGFDHGG